MMKEVLSSTRRMTFKNLKERMRGSTITHRELEGLKDQETMSKTNGGLISAY